MIQEELRELINAICPCCGGAGYYSETGTETVRGEDGCPEPAPCEVQVQCDCAGIKADAITKLFLESLPEKKESEGFTAEEIGFNQAINQITQRWRE